MFALIAALALAAGDPKSPAFTVSHDRIKGVSEATAWLGMTIEEDDLIVGLGFVRRWEGDDRPALDGTATIYMVVMSSSATWTFLKQNDAAILADSARIRPKVVDRDSDIKFKSSFGLTESLAYRLVFADLEVISEAASVEMAVGPKRWALRPDQIAILKEMVANLKVDGATSRELIQEAARKRAEAERAAVQAREEARRKWARENADAIAAVRKEIEDGKAALEKKQATYRADVEAAVEKARSAKRTVPKSRYATVGEKLKWRTFDREIQAVRKKHNLSDGDIEELLKDYPDFGARNKIQ